jgi:uncharacterized protein (DUF2147 family)
MAARVLAMVTMAALCAPALAAETGDPRGRWLTASHDGVVEIYTCDRDQLCGRVVWLKDGLTPGGGRVVDRHNPREDLRSRPVCGLVMMGGLKREGADRWGEGWAYSPENGKTYRLSMSLQPDRTLRLRGYVGIPLFGETQIWTRADPSLGSCQTS